MSGDLQQRCTTVEVTDEVGGEEGGGEGGVGVCLFYLLDARWALTFTSP